MTGSGTLSAQLEGTGDIWESELLAALELACERARGIAGSGGIPEREIRKLDRAEGRLVERGEVEVDWEAFSEELRQADGLTGLLSKAVDHIEEGSLDDAVFGARNREQRAHGLWSSFLVPILQRYGTERPDWQWEAALARELMARWDAEQKSREGALRTIAPLRYFDGPDEAVPIDDDLVIRPFTDQDREELWRDHGRMRGDSLGPIALDRWSHVIDYRWKRPLDSLLGHDIGIDAVEDVVLALRLHHPGRVQRIMIWTRGDPPSDPFTSFHHEAFLLGPAADHDSEARQEMWDETMERERPPLTRIDLGDGEEIGELLRQMRAGRSDRRLALALRRFDSAYSRYEHEDSLIDLWIAFEALLLPDGNIELSHRVSLRIAALLGTGPADRRPVFKQAKRSYNCRSQVVHGGDTKDSVDVVAEETRELARRVLRRWILEPPEGGVAGVDAMLF